MDLLMNEEEIVVVQQQDITTIGQQRMEQNITVSHDGGTDESLLAKVSILEQDGND